MTPIELGWTGLALVGIWLAYLNGSEANRDLRALGGMTNGRRTIAVGNLRREVVRGLVQVDFAILGGMAMFDILVGPVFVSGLLLASFAMNANSYFDRRDRLYLLEYGIQARDDKGRFVRIPETQDQREDRQFGEVRRDLEQKHMDETND